MAKYSKVKLMHQMMEIARVTELGGVDHVTTVLFPRPVLTARRATAQVRHLATRRCATSSRRRLRTARLARGSDESATAAGKIPQTICLACAAPRLIQQLAGR